MEETMRIPPVGVSPGQAGGQDPWFMIEAALRAETPSGCPRRSGKGYRRPFAKHSWRACLTLRSSAARHASYWPAQRRTGPDSSRAPLGGNWGDSGVHVWVNSGKDG
jgi:hypothetical protein